MESSRVVVGTMRWGKWGAGLDTSGYAHLIHTALDSGLNVFDLADIYGDYSGEQEFGAALKAEPGLRSRLHLVTKCGIRMPAQSRPDIELKHYDTSASYVRQSVEQSLLNLNTDYLDLLLIHRPDLLLDPAEMGDVISELKQQGKVKAFGVSNFSVSQVNMLRSRIDVEFHQLEASVLHRDPFMNGQLDQCIEHGIRPMAWSPLAGGKLFGKRSQVAEKVWLCLCQIGEQFGRAPEQIALAWLLRHPSGIIPVIGTSDLVRIQHAADAVEISLTNQQWYAILKAPTGVDVA